MFQRIFHPVNRYNETAVIDLNEAPHHHVVVENEVDQRGQNKGECGHPPAERVTAPTGIVRGQAERRSLRSTPAEPAQRLADDRK